eukprot:2446590-Amphidinium_carterae.1
MLNGGISWDDIVFFSRLRGMTMIKGVEFPPALEADSFIAVWVFVQAVDSTCALEAYLERMSKHTDIPLLSQMAI